MAEAKLPPPLYDQIQSCLYCHIYGVEETDLIQVSRRKSSINEVSKCDGMKSHSRMRRKMATAKAKSPTAKAIMRI